MNGLGAQLPRHQPHPLAPLPANVAPFIRDSLTLQRAMNRLCVATLPCVLAAVYNTGLQINRIWLPGSSSIELRTRALEGLGLGHSATSPLDCIALGASYFVPALAATWIAAGLSELLFARARGRRSNHTSLLVNALLFSLSLPAGLPLWQAALGASIGTVIGKEIFGGFGRNFVHPVLVGLAFLLFAYPGAFGDASAWIPVSGHVAETPLVLAGERGLAGLDAAGLSWLNVALGDVPGAMGQTSALACLLGLGVLLHAGLASWRIVLGSALGLFTGVWLLQGAGLPPAAAAISELPWHWHLVSGSFAFGVVFVATDPVTACVTNGGRWIYGATIGAFVAVIRIANPAYQDGVLLALLLANVSAPLFDRLVALAQMQLNQVRRTRMR